MGDDDGDLYTTACSYVHKQILNIKMVWEKNDKVDNYLLWEND